MEILDTFQRDFSSQRAVATVQNHRLAVHDQSGPTQNPKLGGTRSQSTAKRFYGQYAAAVYPEISSYTASSPVGAGHYQQLRSKPHHSLKPVQEPISRQHRCRLADRGCTFVINSLSNSCRSRHSQLVFLLSREVSKSVSVALDRACDQIPLLVAASQVADGPRIHRPSVGLQQTALERVWEYSV